MSLQAGTWIHLFNSGDQFSTPVCARHRIGTKRLQTNVVSDSRCSPETNRVQSLQTQCDQIGRFIGLLATFQSLWQQLVCPNRPHCQAIFVKVSKSFIFLVKSLLGNFYRHLATFYWSRLLESVKLNSTKQRINFIKGLTWFS